MRKDPDCPSELARALAKATESMLKTTKRIAKADLPIEVAVDDGLVLYLLDLNAGDRVLLGELRDTRKTDNG